MAKITLDNLSFRYPGATQDTITNLNLQVPHGEAHALLGASGAGKTTLLNLLSGLLIPTSGTLTFGDIDVTQLSGRDRDVAQVFQFPVLYESLSVADNLRFPLKTRRLERSMIEARLDYICAELGLDEIRQVKSAQLNLFQKQLTAVGKALMRPDTSLVLLDEPLTAVEPRIKWRLRQTLRRVQADLGVTMIYVTHDQTEALTFAERVSVLTEDGILQTGTPAQIYASPEHEFVGHFVGSPGMNFIPAKTVAIEAAERVGFRPEWASLVAKTSDTAIFQGTVTRIRLQGTEAGQPFGVVSLATEFGEISVRSDVGLAALKVADTLGICVNRYVSYYNQLKVGEGELV